MQLRDFQTSLEQKVFQEWQTHRNVLGVLPTGGGKTAIFSSVMSKCRGLRVALAHRSELVSQMSLSLSVWGIRHRIIAADSTVREIIKLHYSELGKSFYDSNAEMLCAGVDTIINRNEDWFSRVSVWGVDEAHHLLTDNKWGKVVSRFPNAYGLGVTATPLRADGKGLGRGHDGAFDSMVVGPTGRELMDLGWLSDYEVYSFQPDDLDLSTVGTGSTGDYKMPQLRKATHASVKLVGDVVQTYLRVCGGKRGITFAVDIEQARELTHAYQAAGVPAQLVTANTPPMRRAQILREFREGRLLQLVNVDLFGEGFDVPAVECVSMARKTESYGLFAQQLGRCLRPVYAPGTDMTTAEGRLWGIQNGGKPKGVLLDHVGNYISHVLRMGLPEDPKAWTLEARQKRAKSVDDGIRLIPCEGCGKPYEAFHTACPYCGHRPEPAERATPQQVDGDLELVDREALKALLDEIARVDGPPNTLGTDVVGKAIIKNHNARFEAQRELRAAIAQWGGYRTQEGLGVRESQKKFYLDFGVDVLTAQTFGVKDALELKERIAV